MKRSKSLCFELRAKNYLCTQEIFRHLRLEGLTGNTCSLFFEQEWKNYILRRTNFITRIQAIFIWYHTSCQFGGVARAVYRSQFTLKQSFLFNFLNFRRCAHPDKAKAQLLDAALGVAATIHIYDSKIFYGNFSSVTDNYNKNKRISQSIAILYIAKGKFKKLK